MPLHLHQNIQVLKQSSVKGAGGMETASSILRDLLDIRQEIARDLKSNLISKSETTALLKTVAEAMGN